MLQENTANEQTSKSLLLRSMIKGLVLWQVLVMIDRLAVTPYSTGIWLYAPLAMALIFAGLLRRVTEIVYGVAVLLWVNLVPYFSAVMPAVYFIWAFYRYGRYQQLYPEVEQDVAGAGQKQYAGLVRRAAAYMIDFAIFVFLSIPLAQALGGLSAQAPTQNPYHLPINCAIVLVLWLVLALQECSWRRATIGKYAMGLQVVNQEGGRISLGAALLRNGLKVPLFSLPRYIFPVLDWPGGDIAGIGLFVLFGIMLFTPRKQAGYDLAAKTLVLKI